MSPPPFPQNTATQGSASASISPSNFYMVLVYRIVNVAGAIDVSAALTEVIGITCCTVAVPSYSTFASTRRCRGMEHALNAPNVHLFTINFSQKRFVRSSHSAVVIRAVWCPAAVPCLRCQSRTYSACKFSRCQKINRCHAYY